MIKFDFFRNRSCKNTSLVTKINLWIWKIPFKQEWENMGQWSLIYEAMLQKIVDPKIAINSGKGKYGQYRQVSQTILYQWNILIFEDEVDWDEEFSLIFSGESYKGNTKYSSNEDFFFNFSFDWQKFFDHWYKNSDLNNHWEMIFSRIILGNFCKYLMRYQKQSYFYEETTLDSFRDYWRLPHHKLIIPY